MIHKAHINRAQIKNYIVTKNATCKFADIKNLFLEALNAVIDKKKKKLETMCSTCYYKEILEIRPLSRLKVTTCIC